MAFIGNQPLSQAFVTDQFSGNGSTTAFTMSVAPANTASVLVAVSGVLQDPTTYSVSGTTLTFSTAPPTGTGNISARYLGIPASGITTTAYRTVTEFTATASQTTFIPPSYTPGFISVFQNGSLLGSADYTATNGTTVILAVGATVGDLVTVESFYVSSVVNAIPATAGSVISTYIAAGAVGSTQIVAGAVTPTQLNTQAQYTGFKNRIINGAMVFDQRNAGASVTPTVSSYTLDRWIAILSQSSKYSIQQNAGAVTPPVGFTNYLGITSLSAYSITTSDYFSAYQGIEGLNVADLGWGTANAQTITLSFWVRSSLTGTFGGSVKNSATRSYPFTYTISSANTWEQKSVTIPGDTSGTWATDNSGGIYISLAFGVGSTYSGTAGAWASANYVSATGATSVVGTNGATFYITGVQLEKGATATAFDYRPYGTELILCQRYYQSVAYPRTFVNLSGSNAFYTPVYFIVSMRTAPTVTLPSGAGNVVLNSSEVAVVPSFQWNASNITTNSFSLRGGTSNIGGIVEGTATASAEL
jgi:hypothetical protein